MAREKHPSLHNVTIQEALSNSRFQVMMAAFSNQSQLAEFRRRLYSLKRAHSIFKTPEADDYAHFRSRLYATAEIKRIQPEYKVEETQYPLTLVFTCQQPDGKKDLTQKPQRDIDIPRIFDSDGKQVADEINIDENGEEISDEPDSLMDIIGNLGGKTPEKDLT